MATIYVFLMQIRNSEAIYRKITIESHYLMYATDYVRVD